MYKTFVAALIAISAQAAEVQFDWSNYGVGPTSYGGFSDPFGGGGSSRSYGGSSSRRAAPQTFSRYDKPDINPWAAQKSVKSLPPPPIPSKSTTTKKQNKKTTYKKPVIIKPPPPKKEKILSKIEHVLEEELKEEDHSHYDNSILHDHPTIYKHTSKLTYEDPKTDDVKVVVVEQDKSDPYHTKTSVLHAADESCIIDLDG